MPHAELTHVRNSLDEAQGGDQATQMAIVSAIRGVADVLERVVSRQDKQDGKLEEISQTNHSIDKRLSLIENNKLDSEVYELKKRVGELEVARSKQVGGVELIAWLSKNWAILALLLYVVLSSGGHLPRLTLS